MYQYVTIGVVIGLIMGFIAAWLWLTNTTATTNKNNTATSVSSVTPAKSGVYALGASPNLDFDKTGLDI
jgi:hypothetical protein